MRLFCGLNYANVAESTNKMKESAIKFEFNVNIDIAQKIIILIVINSFILLETVYFFSSLTMSKIKEMLNAF